MNVVDSLESKDINQFFKKVNKVHNLCSEKEESTLTEKEKLDLAMKLINEKCDEGINGTQIQSVKDSINEISSNINNHYKKYLELKAKVDFVEANQNKQAGIKEELDEVNQVMAGVDRAKQQRSS